MGNGEDKGDKGDKENNSSTIMFHAPCPMPHAQIPNIKISNRKF
ncbi:histidine kinase [Nostoc linckia]|nr:histidine kinase [Nostoc linckia]